jgi:site-specific DNA recombinase
LATSLLLPKNGATVIVREPVRARPRLAIYVRLSLEQVTSVSLARQRTTLEGYAVALGGIYDPDVDYFEDNDLSAKGTVYRPAAEALLQSVILEEYDGVLVWEFARFMRNVRETHIACSLLRDHAVELYSYEERHLTLYGAGRISIEFAADQAEKEVQKIAARVSAAKEFLARHGAAPGKAPFGTRKESVPSTIPGRSAPLLRLVPDDEPRAELGGLSRADLIRETARTVIAGGSFRSIAMEWNAAGFPANDGSGWRSPTLARMLRNPSLAGYATYKHKVILNSTGLPMKSHVAVLDADTWAELSHILKRRTAHPRGTSDSPLRGLLRCGRCGGGMTRNNATKEGAYRCVANVHGGLCVGNTIAATKTEAFVIEAALEVLADPERLAHLRQDNPQAEVQRQEREAATARLQSGLERLDRASAMGEYDDVDGVRRFKKLKADLVAELDQLAAAERLSRRARHTPRTHVPDGMTPAEAFDAATRQQRLTILSELIEDVEILPALNRAARGMPRAVYRTDRVAINWHDSSLWPSREAPVHSRAWSGVS